MKKTIFLFIALLIISGCTTSASNTSTASSVLKEEAATIATPDPATELAYEEQLKMARQQKIPAEKVSASETTFKLPHDLNELAWSSTEVVSEALTEQHELLLEKGKEIEFPKAERMSINSKQSDVVGEYSLGGKQYELVVDGNPLVGEQYSLRENEKEIVSLPMCYGADGPLNDLRLVESKIALSYRSACITKDNLVSAKSNIFYNGKTFNETYKVDESHFLFSYEGKLGFVAKIKDKEFIYFNGKQISKEYDSIPTSHCCMTIWPIFKVYDNGALVFRAKQGEDYYVTEIDLNKHLE